MTAHDDELYAFAGLPRRLYVVYVVTYCWRGSLWVSVRGHRWDEGYWRCRFGLFLFPVIPAT